MNIKNNIANLISIVRVFFAFGAVAMLYLNTTWAYIIALGLTVITFSLDGVDGYLARKFNQSSDLGAVLDIMGDRIVESSYWITFAVLGWISIIFPLICVVRAFITDGIRSVALSQGFTPFGSKSMQTSKIGSFICSSKIMRITYAVAKTAAFFLLIIVYTPGMELWSHIEELYTVAMILAWTAIVLCVVRAIPVVAESGKLFNK